MSKCGLPADVGSNDGLGVLVAQRAAFRAWIKTQSGYPFAGVFANLMWQSWQGAVAAERDRCAKLAETTHPHDWAFIGSAIRAEPDT